MRNLILFTVLLFSGFVSAQVFDFNCAPVCLEPGDEGYQEYAWSDVVGGQSSQLFTNPWYPEVSIKAFPQADASGWLVTETNSPYGVDLSSDAWVLDWNNPTEDPSFAYIVSTIEAAAVLAGAVIPVSPNCEGEAVPIPGTEVEEEEDEIILEDNSVCVEEVEGGYNLYVSSNYDWFRVPACAGFSSQLVDFRKETNIFLADAAKGQCLADGLLIEFGNASAPYYQLDVKASFSVTASSTCN